MRRKILTIKNCYLMKYKKVNMKSAIAVRCIWCIYTTPYTIHQLQRRCKHLHFSVSEKHSTVFFKKIGVVYCLFLYTEKKLVEKFSEFFKKHRTVFFKNTGVKKIGGYTVFTPTVFLHRPYTWCIV
jgi:hypothetical protein